MKVLYAAAHGGFAHEHVPLGGGAAVWRMLRQEWERTQPFPVEDLTPPALALRKTGAEIVGFDTGSYARFCREFERAATQEILRHDPRETVVLVNDIAEAPDFGRLRQAGFAAATIWHVDVVDYIASIYLRKRVAPRTLVRLHRALEPLCPDTVQLIFRKQADCVRHSEAHIVPSPEMKRVILDCYPETAPEKIHVVPWGAVAPDGAPGSWARARSGMGIPENATVLLLLSRISPEKNQALLLEALLGWERRPDYPKFPLHLVVAGAPAFMQGIAYYEKLRRLAARLKKVHVHWPGYVHGQGKQDLLAAADLYVFPSRHESYGLTLLEAFQAGLPALTLDHAGARAVMDPAFGAMAAEQDFPVALDRLLADRAQLPAMGAAARAYATAHPFADSAARLAAIVRGLRRG